MKNCTSSTFVNLWVRVLFRNFIFLKILMWLNIILRNIIYVHNLIIKKRISYDG